MVFAGGKDGSNGFVKRVASSFSMRKKKNTDDPKGLTRSKSTGADYGSRRQPAKKVSDLMNKNRTKSAGVSPQPRREKIDDLGKGFGKWRYFDDGDSVWLSSDCTSSSSFLEQRRLSVSFHFSVDERVVSWLSNLANSSLTLDNEVDSIKGHRRVSKKGQRLVSRNTKETAEKADKEASKEGKIRNSATNSVGKIPANPSDEGNKNGGRKSCEGSIGSNSFMTAPNSTSLDSSPQASEAKRVSFLKSSGAELERERENSPSPSNSGVVPSDSQISAASTLVEPEKHQSDDKRLKKVNEKVDSKKRIVVEPLFWPFEQKFDWTAEDILKHFSMSPRRKKSLSAKNSGGTSSKSMRVQLQTRKLDFKEGCKRKLVFNGPGPNESTNIPELRRNISNNSNSSSSKKNDNYKNNNNKINGSNKTGMKRVKSMPSRLGKSSKVSTKVVPLGAEAEETPETEKEKTAAQKLNGKSRTFLEDDYASINDFSIENVVGLDKENATAQKLNRKSRTFLEDDYASFDALSLENLMELAKEKPAAQKLNRKNRTFLEDDFASMNDFSIENIVGLCEFNGREGIDSDFNGEVFLLDDNL